ncbi:uncharacterized protein LOC111715645 [Eurytemora carolleeae]|uniref:uncharacterized protein LOC111715645 n=1 Tax=Eurytemora carolleeae TaxID=1294199 RepID=UPI000C75DF3D|nr:uncharacterized protein LOC111715645 [Eurytemora carolleeae]|eukprot:XP_023346761.1 uncharacterized protein LOC111715645 [Eurytemora affinis]
MDPLKHSLLNNNILHIKTINWTDIGNITCSARNEAGYAEATQTISGKPTVPVLSSRPGTKPNIQVVYGQSVSVSSVLFFNIQTRNINRRTDIRDSEWNITLLETTARTNQCFSFSIEVDVHDCVQVIVTAENNFGTSLPSPTLTLQSVFPPQSSGGIVYCSTVVLSWKPFFINVLFLVLNISLSFHYS